MSLFDRSPRADPRRARIAAATIASAALGALLAFALLPARAAGDLVFGAIFGGSAGLAFAYILALGAGRG